MSTRNRVRNTALICWISSLAIFVLLLVWAGRDGNLDELWKSLSLVWVGDIAFGIAAFLTMIFTSVNSGNQLAKEFRKEEKKVERIVERQTPSFWMMVSIVLLIVLAYLLGSKNSAFLNFSATVSPTPTQDSTFVDCIINGQTTRATKDTCDSLGKYITPTVVFQRNNSNTTTSNSKIDCTGPDGKHFIATQKECDEFNTAWGNGPTPDPNEIIQCNIHVNCGGGTKEMTRASCEQSTCCSLSSGNVLTSQGDCKQKHYTECVNQLIAMGIKNVEYYDIGCGKYK